MNGQASRLIELRQLADRNKINIPSRIISICSGKGGTGKTFFSANFAYQLSRKNQRVLLVDLDLNFSNLNILLNKTSSNSISQFFEQKNGLRELIYNHSNNLDLIFGDSGRSNFPRVSNEIIDYLFTSFAKIQDRYDYIILDSSAGADDLVIHQLHRSDYILLVISPEPTAIMDAYVVIKLLKESGTDNSKLVVVNKCADQEEANSAFGNLSTAVSHFLGERIHNLGFISFNKEIHRSIINQELLADYSPASQSLAEITALTDSFNQFIQMVNNSHSQ